MHPAYIPSPYRCIHDYVGHAPHTSTHDQNVIHRPLAIPPCLSWGVFTSGRAHASSLALAPHSYTRLRDSSSFPCVGHTLVACLDPVRPLHLTRSFVGDAPRKSFSPVCSKASCCPMSGPLMLPVKANRMGWNRRFPFLVNALPFACVTRARDVCVASCFLQKTPKLITVTVEPCIIGGKQKYSNKSVCCELR